FTCAALKQLTLWLRRQSSASANQGTPRPEKRRRVDAAADPGEQVVKTTPPAHPYQAICARPHSHRSTLAPAGLSAGGDRYSYGRWARPGLLSCVAAGVSIWVSSRCREFRRFL